MKQNISYNHYTNNICFIQYKRFQIIQRMARTENIVHCRTNQSSNLSNTICLRAEVEFSFHLDSNYDQTCSQPCALSSGNFSADEEVTFSGHYSREQSKRRETHNIMIGLQMHRDDAAKSKRSTKSDGQWDLLMQL